MFTNERVFLRQFFSRYHTTGSVLPSSRALARALCRYVNSPSTTVISAKSSEPPQSVRESVRLRSEAGAGRDILEVGPGTGAVTACLVRKMRPSDRLTLVELND